MSKQGPLDPFAIAEPELESVSERLRRSLLTDIPALGRAAEYFFQVRTVFLPWWQLLTAKHFGLIT